VVTINVSYVYIGSLPDYFSRQLLILDYKQQQTSIVFAFPWKFLH